MQGCQPWSWVHELLQLVVSTCCSCNTRPEQCVAYKRILDTSFGGGHEQGQVQPGLTPFHCSISLLESTVRLAPKLSRDRVL
jgi:hypothetical protein